MFATNCYCFAYHEKTITMKKEPLKVVITEMWLAEVGDKHFYGTIKRSKDANGNPHLFSRININDGIVQGYATNRIELGKNMDAMCAMYLSGIHNDKGVSKTFKYPNHLTIPFSYAFNRMFLN